jgi:hypothetical protein
VKGTPTILSLKSLFGKALDFLVWSGRAKKRQGIEKEEISFDIQRDLQYAKTDSFLTIR